MRFTARSVALGLLLAIACGLAGVALLLWVALPRIIGDESFRESASAALGRELNYSRVELAYSPPTIILINPTLGGASAFARADRVMLEISLAPLLARVLLVDSASVEGAVLTVERSHRGIQLASGSRVATGENESGDRATKPSLRFAVRTLVASDATLIFEDSTVSPAIRWELRDSKLQVESELRLNSAERKQRFQLVGEVATGGRIFADGEIKATGETDARVRVEAVSIAPAAPYFASMAGAEGALTGTVDARGRNVAFDFALDEGRLTLGEIALQGTMAITGRIDDATGPTRGQIELDATGAELRYGDFFTKPPGTSARVRGQVTAGEDGTLRIDAWKFEMEDFDGRADPTALRR